MKLKNGVAHITPAGRSVFADLGFDENETLDLQTRSQAIIDEKRAIKGSLMDATERVDQA